MDDLFAGLLDDAAIFPPGNLPLERALAEHREHRATEYAGLVGPLVVGDGRLPDLLELLDPPPEDEPPLAVTVVVSGGAGAIEGAARWASRASTVLLGSVEVALRDEEDLAHNARRILAMTDSLTDELDGVDLVVEMPRVHGLPGPTWLAALDELASREATVKFRTGGVEPGLVPAPEELAACLDAALDRELSFKCTAGLHRALRHRDEATGEWRHGFLNVLAATRATLEGDSAAEVLSATEPDRVLPRLASSARRWFRSFGTCSVLEPHDDLVELGLL